MNYVASAADQALMKDIMSRFKSMQDVRRPLEPMWFDITRYLYPQRSGWDFDDMDILTRGEDIYDGKPISCHLRFADGLYSQLVSQAIDWLMFEPYDPAMKDNQEILRFCQELSRYLYDVFSRSNFYETLAIDFKDATALGTSVIYIDDDEEGLPVYTPLHMRGVYLSENKSGKADTLFNRMEMTARDILESFSKIDPKVQAEMRKNIDAKYIVLHAMFPRGKDKETGIASFFRKSKPMASIYILEGESKPGAGASPGKGLMVLENGGTDYQRFSAWRCERIVGLPYGSCPGFAAIYDTKMMHMESKTFADVAQLAARPPVQAPEGMRGNIRIFPGGVSYGASQTGGKIEPILTSISYPPMIEELRRREESLNLIFHTDYFTPISQIQQGSRERTRTEVMQMKAESAALLGSIIGRAVNERISPLVFTTIAHELARGELPKPPSGVPKDLRLKLMVTSPLAQSQKKYMVVDGITKGLSAALQLQPAAPDVVMNFNLNDAARRLAVTEGFPVDLMYPKDDVKKAQDQAAEARRKAAEAQAQNERLAAAGRGARAAEPGSPTAAMMGMGQGR